MPQSSCVILRLRKQNHKFQNLITAAACTNAADR
uniref:Uncharacterized protein n=1 Tax=Anguilla anguilla TaxID=7936 RepID=A0A0E9UB13_ANGAN